MDRATGGLQLRARGTFVLIYLAIIAFDFLPLDLTPAVWTGPDLMLAVTLVWVVRRPQAAPVMVIAALFLMADLLYHRPPGLWAGLVVVLTETLRRQHHDMRAMHFLAEWGAVATGIVLITLANRLVLALTMVPLPQLGLGLFQMIATIAIYPAVVLLAHAGFGLRRRAPGDMNPRGQLR